MKFERMKELALMASRGETGPRNFTVDRAWLEAYTRLVLDEVNATAGSTGQSQSIALLSAWCDGQTVCPPELLGDAQGLAKWCTDALGALVAGRDLPQAAEYKTAGSSGQDG